MANNRYFSNWKKNEDSERIRFIKKNEDSNRILSRSIDKCKTERNAQSIFNCSTSTNLNSIQMIPHTFINGQMIPCAFNGQMIQCIPIITQTQSIIVNGCLYVQISNGVFIKA